MWRYVLHILYNGWNEIKWKLKKNEITTPVRITKSYNKNAQKVQKREVEWIFSNWGGKAIDDQFGRQSISFL